MPRAGEGASNRSYSSTDMTTTMPLGCDWLGPRRVYQMAKAFLGVLSGYGLHG